MAGVLQGAGERHPDLDLDSVRTTLEYMRDDLERVAGLESAAAALSLALREIDALDTGQVTPHAPAPLAASFAPNFRKLLAPR